MFHNVEADHLNLQEEVLSPDNIKVALFSSCLL